MILRELKLASHEGPQIVSHVIIPCRERDHGSTIHYQDRRVTHRLCRECALLPAFQTKRVARQIERSDLTAAIDEDSGGPNGAADNLVKAVRGLLLPIDLLVPHE